MTRTVTLLSGPAGAGKTRRLLERYRSVLAASEPGAALWLAPTSRAAAEIQGRLLGGVLDACFAPGIFTFARFTSWVLVQSPLAMRPVSPLMKRHLLRQQVEAEQRAGRLPHFGPIAATSGLLDILCEFIGQMKRLEIWPEDLERSCRARGVGQKDRELLAIYQAYQQRLLDHHLYDLEGRFWSARDLLRKSDVPLKFKIVVADGFSDFTKTEHDMLETLAATAEEAWISLPLESEAGREDLFQKPLRTREELKRRHKELREESLPRPAKTAWPALAHIERTIFSNPRTMQPAPDVARLEILAGGRQIGEIELIGRTIKRLLIDGDRTHHAPRDADRAHEAPCGGRPHAERGEYVEEHVRPGDIAVVFRQPQPLADLVSEVFARLEIPFFLENAQPLSRSSAVVLLLRLLELDAEDWPRNTLLAVLGNNYFSPDGIAWNDSFAGRAERDIRRLQIPRGRERLLDRVGRAERSADPPPNGDDGAPDGGSALRSARPTRTVLRWLADALDQLPRSDTLAGHAKAWNALAERVGIFRSMRGRLDEAAWKQLHETLIESEHLAQWLGEDAPRLDRRQAREALVDALGSQAMGVANEEPGRVRVLSAASARHLKIPYLFLAGLSEKAFPAAERDEGVYSQAERQRLIEAGLPLPGHSDRQTDEMLLFYEVVNSAMRRLWLSYPAIDEKGEPLTPSPFVKEIEQACGATEIVRHGAIDLSPVPAEDDVCSLDGFRIRAVAEARAGNAKPLGGFVQHAPRAGESLLAGLAFTLARQNRERFGASEGMLSTDAAELLAAQFPPDRIFSATELERYAGCPYQYFLERVLKVRPLEEIELETDFAQRGKMAHDLLALFHRRVNEVGRGPASPAALEEEEFARILAAAAEEALADADRDSAAPGDDALREVDRRKLLRWLETYRDQHAKYDAQGACDGPPLPELFEISFGRELIEGEGPPSTPRPLELTSGGETVRLTGRIDRIDVGRVGRQTVFNILDYKTGSGTRFSVEACQRGTALQLPIYALAAAELILGDRAAQPWQAGYWYVSGDGFKPRQALVMGAASDGRVAPSETWNEVRAMLAETVIELVKAMRRGEFPVWSQDPDCTGHCPFKTVCRINHIRSLEKEWRP